MGDDVGGLRVILSVAEGMEGGDGFGLHGRVVPFALRFKEEGESVAAVGRWMLVE